MRRVSEFYQHAKELNMIVFNVCAHRSGRERWKEKFVSFFIEMHDIDLCNKEVYILRTSSVRILSYLSSFLYCLLMYYQYIYIGTAASLQTGVL